MVILCGIDLAGTARRPTGIAVINLASNKNVIKVLKLYSDEEIIEYILSLPKNKPIIVAIDSPLSLPPDGKWYREVDIVMKKKGYHVFPPRWRGMEKLTLRAIKLSKYFTKHGIEVIETHPKSALKSSRCNSLRELLAKLDLRIEERDYSSLSRDEIDAIIACITALYYWEKKAYPVKASDGIIYLLPEIC